MGYLTYHTLEVIGVSSEIDHAAQIDVLSGYGSGLFEESVKWYGRVKDMTKYSELHPTVLFKIHGEGEEAGDLWNEYWQNGKHQHCQGRIEYKPYDVEEMK